MATYLNGRLGGRVALDTQIDLPSNVSWYIKFKTVDVTQAKTAVVIGDGTTFSERFLFDPANNRVNIRMDGGNFQGVISYADIKAVVPSFSPLLPFTYELRATPRSGSGFDINLYVNNLDCGVLAGTSGNITFNITHFLSTDGSTDSDLGLFFIEIGQAGSVTNRWDANTTGSSFVTTTGTNNATLLGFPTDDSQWQETVPVANAGISQFNKLSGSTVTLDGSGSYSTSGGALSFSWGAPSGVTLSDSTAANPTFTVASKNIDEDLTFTLTVTEDGISSTSTTLVSTLAEGSTLGDAWALNHAVAAFELTVPTLATVEAKSIEIETITNLSLSESTFGRLCQFAGLEIRTGNSDTGLGYVYTRGQFGNDTNNQRDKALDLPFKITEENIKLKCNLLPSTLGDPSTSSLALLLNNIPILQEETTWSADSAGATQSAKISSGNGDFDHQGKMRYLKVRMVDINDVVYEAHLRNVTGTNATQWEDISGNGHHATIATAIASTPNLWVPYQYGIPPVAGDETAPTLTVSGANTTITVGDDEPAYTATATDNVDGDITANIVKTGTVNTGVAGTYTLTWNVSDAVGNAATPVTRTVTVLAEPNTAPVANLGSGNITVASGATILLDGSASLDVDGTISTYSWLQTSGTNALIDDNDSVTTFAVAPTLNADETLTFTLTVTDNDGATNTATLNVLVLEDVPRDAPIAVAGNGATNIVVGNTITLDGSQSTGQGTLTYRWRQIKGVFGEVSNRFVSSPTFTVPQLTTKSAFGQDIYVDKTAASIANPLLPYGLTKHLNISYLGAFRPITTISGNRNPYQSGTIGLSEDNTRIFMTTHVYDGGVLDFDIPSTFSMSTDVNAVTAVSENQLYTGIYDVVTVGSTNRDKINGFLEFDGKLLATAERFYDTGDTSDNLFLLNSSADFTLGGDGFYKLAGGSRIGGNMSKIPQDSQALLGGATHIATWSTVYSINGRYSIGPSLYTFNPQDILDADPEVNPNISSVEFMNYTLSNMIAPDANTWVKDTSPLWGGVTKSRGGFVIPNTSYIIFFGDHSGNVDGNGYKITQDTGNVCGGGCPYTATDEYGYYWMYDLNDIINAQNTYDPRPFSYGVFQLPIGRTNVRAITGVAFDADNNRLYLTQSINDQYPLVMVYSLTAKTEDTATIDTNASELVFELEVTDDQGAKATDLVTFTYNTNVEVDTTRPVITLTGSNAITIDIGDTVPVLAYSAIDNTDGDITANVVVTGQVANNQIAGTYTQALNVQDAAGNNALQVIRTVEVQAAVDTTTPTLAANPSTTSYSLTVGDTFTPPVVSWTDNGETDTVATPTPVRTTNGAGDAVDTYTYNYSDAAGNAATTLVITVTYNAVVVAPDTTRPVITLLGDATVQVTEGSTYTDAGATALDNVDGNITSDIVTTNPVDESVIGQYIVRYNVADAAENDAIEVTRTVNVVAVVRPQITLLGDGTVVLALNQPYTDAGATANDATDGDITGDITTVDPVDESFAAIYTVTYNVTNSNGVAAIEATRTVVVEAAGSSSGSGTFTTGLLKPLI